MSNLLKKYLRKDKNNPINEKFSLILIILSMIITCLSPGFTVACSWVSRDFNHQASWLAATDDENHQLYPIPYIFLAFNPKGSKFNTHLANVLAWQSKYNTVSILEYDKYKGALRKDYRFSLNTEGLSVYGLTLTSSKYPQYNKNKKDLYTTDIPIFLTSEFKTVNEVVKYFKGHELQVNIVNPLHSTKVSEVYGTHYILFDKEGHSGLIEYINGKLNLFTNVHVITNDPDYPTQLKLLQNFVHFGGKEPIPSTYDDPDRFQRLSAFYQLQTRCFKKYPKKIISSVNQERYMHDLLNSVISPEISFKGDSWYTYWYLFLNLNSGDFNLTYQDVMKNVRFNHLTFNANNTKSCYINLNKLKHKFTNDKLLQQMCTSKPILS